MGICFFFYKTNLPLSIKLRVLLRTGLGNVTATSSIIAPELTTMIFAGVGRVELALNTFSLMLLEKDPEVLRQNKWYFAELLR